MKPTILLYIEDNDTSLAMKALLESEGYAPQTVQTTDECLHSIANTNPALVLLDAFKPREKIIQVVSQSAATKIAYVNAEELDSDLESVYDNVVGAVESIFDNKTFLAKIKRYVKVSMKQKNRSQAE